MARSTGNGSSLFPDGVKSIEEVPVDLLRAISHANKILDWHENLSSDEIPPEWMWPFDKRLSEHFDEIKEARNNPEAVDDREVVPMMTNEMAGSRG